MSHVVPSSAHLAERRLDRDRLPATLTERYRIGAELGGGTDTRVVRAWDTALQRDVAIKLLRTRSASPEQLAQQEREGRLLASLNHRALTILHDVGLDVGEPQRPITYLVMEYVQGPDLQRRLLDGPLDALQVCWLGHDLGDALAALHGSGVLHRDLKPANVLLTAPGADDRLRCKLTDFGISSLISAPHVPGHVQGTAAYIAPEQVEDRPATPASDVYSLGLVLIEALSGARAYPGSPDETAVARLDRGPEIPDGLPAGLCDLLRAMTALDPLARPTAVEAARRFHDLALDESARRRGSVVAGAEQLRLAAVERYGILDTPPEDAFDELAALARRVLRVPVALIAITDRDRVWFKSRRDFAEQQIDRNLDLCELVDSDQGVWSIRDASADPRTRESPLVRDAPHVRAFAAARLRTHDGHDIGSLCVLDAQPRDFSTDDLAILFSLAAVVMRELELRLASRRVVFNRRAGDPPEPSRDRRPSPRSSGIR